MASARPSGLFDGSNQPLPPIQEDRILRAYMSGLRSLLEDLQQRRFIRPELYGESCRHADEVAKAYLLNLERHFSKYELIVISIGSSGDSTLRQQHPGFVEQSNKTALVINIDPEFEVPSNCLGEGDNVVYIPWCVDQTRHFFFNSLNALIGRQLNQGKQVVLLYHTSPHSYLSLAKIILDNQKHLDQRFVVIGSYNSIDPVIVYSKQGILNLCTDKAEMRLAVGVDLRKLITKTYFRYDDQSAAAFNEEMAATSHLAKCYQHLADVSFADVCQYLRVLESSPSPVPEIGVTSRA